jgi:chromosome segregation protein
MQLLSLSINGFKSFAKSTKLDFAPGITAVVGPNGCGKSNIVDSLRWGLGEQRSSVLRGERMENVIFNGTAVRKPAGMAEVKIMLDNAKGLLNLPFAEVEIARRLFRDGTSEYLLNQKECRLKDVQDLLHDSGMGPNLYTILELKMVEDILREDGEGRRALFEEAAGVAKYKLRRRQALQKLAQTQEDLTRLADILAEVERQVSSLKRQAMRAKRYEELSKQLRALEAALLYREYVRLTAELQPLEQTLSASSATSEAVKSAIRLEETKLQDLRLRELEIDRDLGEQRKGLSAVATEISALEAEEAGLRARDQAARQTIERAQREAQLLGDKRALHDMRLAESEVARRSCETDLSEWEKRVGERTDRLHEADADLNSATVTAQTHAEQVSVLRNALSSLRTEASEIAMTRAGHVSQMDMLRGELSSMAQEREALLAKRAEMETHLQQCDAQEQTLRDGEKALLDEMDQRRHELQHFEERLRSLTSLSEAVTSRIELLATLEDKGPRAAQAVRFLKAKPVEGLLELLGDAVDVEEKYRRALQAALGPAAYYYLTESVESALRAMDMLRKERAGQTTFLPVAEFQAEPLQTLPLPQGALKSGLSVLRTPTANPVLQHFLARVVIVPDWETALTHYAWARDHECTLVTLDGEWIGYHGILCGGSSETGLPTDLGLAKQMMELRQRLEQLSVEREQTGGQLRQARSTLATLEQTLAERRRDLESLSAQRAMHREQQVKAETRLSALDERQHAGEAGIRERETYVVECDQRQQIYDARMADAERELQTAVASGDVLQRNMAAFQKETAVKRDDLHAGERERDAARHRLESVATELERTQQAIADIDDELQRSGQNAEQAANDIVSWETRLREIDELSVQKYRARDDAAQAVDQVVQKLDELRHDIADQEERLRNLRESHAGEMEGEKRIELDAARLRGELDALLNNARQQMGFELAANDFAEQHPEIQTVEATPELLQESKQKIERLGPVNSLAAEEYAQESARLESMLSQRDDLLKAKQTLEETIARINETAQSRFLHTFEAVRAHFQRLFQEFFPAGEADLIISGQDLLDADITLWANPSGKRLKSLSLMSGGEKTMTAIALLFALYQVKPSPFCVFDEVDAPLDDANIERFNRMIRMHSESTQFILITHNRRTMEIADNLYGVTMEEEGISKLVSVRLLSSVE